MLFSFYKIKRNSSFKVFHRNPPIQKNKSCLRSIPMLYIMQQGQNLMLAPNS